MFFVDPVKAFLVLERDGQVAENVDEASPLRRYNMDADETKVPIFWDSRTMGEYVAVEANRQKPPTKRKQKGTPIPPPRLIFVARRGERFDGHALVEDVLSAGNIFIGEFHWVEDHLKKQNCPVEWIRSVLSHPLFVKVRSSESALCRLLEAASDLHSHQFSTIAVTGTNGKTSVTQITASLLDKIIKKPVLKLGTLGIEMGDVKKEGVNPTMPDFPDFLTAVREAKELGISHIVMEATSHGLVQGRMGNWLADVGIFTNLTQDHLDYHKTMEAYRDAKALLFERHVKHGGTIVLNTDDEQWRFFCGKGAHAYRNVIGVGRGSHKREFFEETRGKYMSVRYLEVSNRLILKTGIQGVWVLENEKEVLEQANFSCQLIGSFQHDNLAFSTAALLGLGYPLSQIAQAVANVKSIPGRLELVTLPQRTEAGLPTVLVDYAHTPDALEKALKTCREINKKKGKLFCVFGCGGDRDKTKRPLMGKISKRLSDISIVTSDNPRTEEPDAIVDDIIKGMGEQSAAERIVEVNRRAAIENAVFAAGADDLILIAGKGHENYQIIGTKKIDFSDVEVARSALLRKIRKNTQEAAAE